MAKRKRQQLDTADKAIAAGAGVAALPITREQVNLHTRRYDWNRPNGETIRLQGFKDKDIKRLKPGLNKVNATLGDHVKLDTTINKQRSFMPGMIAAGEFIPKEDQQHMLFKETGLSKKKVDRAITIGKATRRIHTSHGTVRIHPDVLSDQGIRGKAHPSGILTHELGHAVDFSKKTSYSNDPSYKEALSHSHTHMFSSTRAYGDSNRYEHFAESYRSRLGFPMEDLGVTHSIWSGPHSRTNSSSNIDKFFRRHELINPPHPDRVAKITKVQPLLHHAGPAGAVGLSAMALAYEGNKHEAGIKKAWHTRKNLYGPSGRKKKGVK